MDVYPMLCENYNGMSQSFYAQYKDATEYLKSLKCGSWDLISHTYDENEKYCTAQSMRLHSAIAAIVFQALSIEAFVNYMELKRLEMILFIASMILRVQRLLEN